MDKIDNDIKEQKKLIESTLDTYEKLVAKKGKITKKLNELKKLIQKGRNKLETKADESAEVNRLIQALKDIEKIEEYIKK